MTSRLLSGTPLLNHAKVCADTSPSPGESHKLWTCRPIIVPGRESGGWGSQPPCMAWERTRDWTTFEIENHHTTPAPPRAPAGPCGLTPAARWPPALIESSDTQSCFRARLGGQMDEYELDSSLAGHRHAVSATACNVRSAQHDRRDWCTSMHEHACTAVSVESEHQLARHRGRCRRDPHNTRPVQLLFWVVPQKT